MYWGVSASDQPPKEATCSDKLVANWLRAKTLAPVCQT